MPRLRSLGSSIGCGAVAQLGERLVRNEEVRGSIPLGSTTAPISSGSYEVFREIAASSSGVVHEFGTHRGMLDMSKPSGLIQRKYVYAFRQRIPADVVSAFGGKREIKVSLRTRDGRTARRLCLIEAAKWETEFARIREQRGFSLVDRRTASLTVSELEARIHRYIEVEFAQQLDDFVSCQWTKGQRDDRTVETGELRCAYRDPAEIQTLIDIYSTERRLFGKSGIPDNFSEHHKT